MNGKQFLLSIVVAFAAQCAVKAQTNVQFFYDFGSDRQYYTATIEGFYLDDWGDTFFFIDQDLNALNKNSSTYSIGGSYMEISRNINFWRHMAIAPLSLHFEYNGGLTVGESFQNAFLAGLDYGIKLGDGESNINLQVLFKYIAYKDERAFSKAPLQFTGVWNLRDIFGVKGLDFCGFADFWWEDHKLLIDHFGEMLPEHSSIVFMTEPQIWYNVGRLFGCRQLNIGAEIKLSYDAGVHKGFWYRPCAGIKWEF